MKARLQRKDLVKTVAIYFLVAALMLASNLIPFGVVAGFGILPWLLSILLLLPLWAWHRNYIKKASLSKQIQAASKSRVLFWTMTLFFLAFVVRVPSILLFGQPYEKTPLIYLVVLSIVVLMSIDLSAFGFKTSNFGRALLLGIVYYLLFSLLPPILLGIMFYVLKGQVLIAGFNLLVFFFNLPFQILCVGISEEGLFRGYMQTRFSRVFSFRKAIFLQALLFGLWHFIWHVSPLDWFGMLEHVGNTFIIGLLFGYFYGIAANLTPLVLAHGLNNSVLTGFVENQVAYNTLQTLPWYVQLLLFIVPYAVSWTLTFLSTKFLIKAIMGIKKS